MLACTNCGPCLFSLAMLTAYGLFGILFISTCAANSMRRETTPLGLDLSAPIVRVERNSKRYCGQDINNVLQLLCKGEYNTMFKRSIASKRARDLFTEMPAGPNDDFAINSDGNQRDSACLNSKDELPIMTRSEALAALGRRHGRKKRGVYDECCRKSCTLDELSDYCAI